MDPPVPNPKAGQIDTTAVKRIAIGLSCAAAAAILIFLFTGGIQRGVAKDLEGQYEMARRSGNSMDLCVRASLVAEAHLQAHNEDRYVEWENIETLDCARAGISR